MASLVGAFVAPVSASRSKVRAKDIPQPGLCPALQAKYERNATFGCYPTGVPSPTAFAKRFKNCRYSVTASAVNRLYVISKARRDQGLPELVFTECDWSLLRACNEVTGYDKEDPNEPDWNIHEARAGLLRCCKGELTHAAGKALYGPSAAWFEKWKRNIRVQLGLTPAELPTHDEGNLRAVIASLPIQQSGQQPMLLPHEAALLAGHLCKLSELGLNECRNAMRAFGREVLFDAGEAETDPKKRARLLKARRSPTWLKGVLRTSKLVGGVSASFRKAHAISDLRALATDPKREKEYRKMVEGMYDEVLGKGVRPAKDTMWGGDEAAFGQARYLSSLSEIGMGAFQATHGEHFPWQVTVFSWNNAELGVPQGLPIEVIHKAAAEPSMYHLMNLPEDALVACTESGYQDKKTFFSAVTALVEFIRREREDGTRDEHPHFLHLDGHFSHFSPEALDLLLDNNIHVFFIPSHSSQRLQSADCGLQACFKAVLKDHLHALLAKLPVSELSIPLINGIIASAWPVFQGRSVEVSSNAYKYVGLYPFLTAEMVTRTPGQLLLLSNAGGDVPGEAWEEAVAAEAEMLRQAEQAEHQRLQAGEEKEYAEQRQAMVERQAEETKQRLLRHAEEAREERGRQERELQLLATGHPGAVRSLLRGEASRNPGAHIAAVQQQSRATGRATAAAAGAAAPSAEQQAIVAELTASGGSDADIQKAMAAALAAPAAAGQLLLPAFVASGGQVVIRHAVAASVARNRGMTPEENTKRRAAEAAAKKLKPARAKAKGSLQTKAGARVQREQVAQLQEEERQGVIEADEKAKNQESKKRKRDKNATDTIRQGMKVLRRADIKDARDVGDVQDHLDLLRKLKNPEKVAVITLVQPSILPTKRTKPELDRVLGATTDFD